jgi:hypothetical protein
MVRRAIPIDWDIDAFLGIDTSLPGKHYIFGEIWPSFRGLGLDDTDISLIVEVRDPALPCIASVDATNRWGEKYFTLVFWDTYDPVDDNVVLWRSDDEGETWYDATWSDDMEWDGDEIFFYYDTLAQPVWLVLEHIGVGDSNTVVLSEKSGLAVGGPGGDRTGIDRSGVGTGDSATPGDGGDNGDTGKQEPSQPQGGDNGDTGKQDPSQPQGGDNGDTGKQANPLPQGRSYVNMRRYSTRILPPVGRVDSAASDDMGDNISVNVTPLDISGVPSDDTAGDEIGTSDMQVLPGIVNADNFGGSGGGSGWDGGNSNHQQEPQLTSVDTAFTQYAYAVEETTAAFATVVEHIPPAPHSEMPAQGIHPPTDVPTHNLQPYASALAPPDPDQFVPEAAFPVGTAMIILTVAAAVISGALAAFRFRAKP